MPALQPNCEQGSEDREDEQARHQLEVYDGRLTCDVCRRYVSTTASAADKARFRRAPCQGAIPDLARQRVRTQHAARQALVLATEERKSVAAALRPDSPGPLQTALSSERGLVATFYGLELDAGASGSDAACADAASRRSGFRSPSPSPRVPRARSPGAGAGARLRSRSRQKLAEALECCDTLKAACRSFGPLQALPLASVASAPQASPAASAPHQPQAGPSVAQIVRGGGRLRSRSRRRIAMADVLMGAIRGGAAEVTSSGCAATGNSVADASSSGGFGSGDAAVLAALARHTCCLSLAK